MDRQELHNERLTIMKKDLIQGTNNLVQEINASSVNINLHRATLRSNQIS